MKKHIATIILILLAATLLVACRNSGDNNGTGTGSSTRRPAAPSRDDSIIDNFIYRSNHLLLDKLPEPASGVLVDGERIIYWYTDSTPQIMIRSLAANVDSAISMRVATIPADGWRISVGGLQINEDGNIELIKVEDFEDGAVTVTHAIYDTAGNEVSSNDLTDIIKPVDGFVRIEQVVFADDGNMAVVVKGSGPENTMYLLDNEGKLLGDLTLDFRESIAKMRDGRVVILQFEGLRVNSDTTNLRVINFESAERDETIPVPVQNARQMIPAGVDQPFDILLGDGSHIYGYNEETNTLTPLLDWMESGVISTYDHHIAVLTDDRIVLLSTEFIPVGEESEWYTDFHILTRLSRADLPPKTIITLGGFTYCETISREVIKFNQENPYYQIEIISPGPWNEDIRIQRDRIVFEVVTGRGPDILFDAFSFVPIDAKAFTDLYPFIDADPDLNRSDFFPSVLNIFETANGELPYIPRAFNVYTSVAYRETAELIGPITYTNLLRMLDEHGFLTISGELSYIIGVEGTYFDLFIDSEANQAYFDSEDFISWLEMVARGTLFSSWEDYNTQADWERPGDSILRMRNGEQILHDAGIDSPGDFRILQALLGDVVAVGSPTRTGGQHSISIRERFGINVNSHIKMQRGNLFDACCCRMLRNFHGMEDCR